MRLVDYLMTPVQPLCEPEEQPKRRRGNPAPNAELGWKAKQAKSEAKYRAVMGNSWMTTTEIERKLGMASSTARDFLMSRFDTGQLERRKAGPADSWTRNKGYEWRWT